MAKTNGPRTVECYLCRHQFEVSGRGMSTSCPGCFKPVLVEDCVLSRNRPKLMMVTKLQTCGRIVVPKGTRLVAQLIEAGEGIEVAGHLHAAIKKHRQSAHSLPGVDRRASGTAVNN